MEDSSHTMGQLSNLMKNCVSCHAMYRIDIWSSNIFLRLTAGLSSQTESDLCIEMIEDRPYKLNIYIIIHNPIDTYASYVLHRRNT
jgi:hypothetical protein